MSTPGTEFDQLMERVRAGDSEAARELFERYGKAIQMVVRQRLSRRMRSQFDSLDFVQDAWASFFHIPAERFTFQTPDDLVAFLARLARHKVIDAYRRRFRAARRNAERATPLPEEEHQPAAQQPTPSQVAIADETWDRLLQNKPPKVRRALEMLRAGHSRQEIADSLGVTKKTVQRVIENLKDRPKSS